MWAVEMETVNISSLPTHLRAMATRLLEHDVGKDVVLSQVHGSVETGLTGLVDRVDGWQVH